MQRTEKGKQLEKRRKKIRHKRKRQDKNRRQQKVNMTQTIEENRRYRKTGENVEDKAHGNIERKFS